MVMATPTTPSSQPAAEYSLVDPPPGGSASYHPFALRMTGAMCVLGTCLVDPSRSLVSVLSFLKTTS